MRSQYSRHSIAPQLHRNRNVTRCSHASIHNDRVVGIFGLQILEDNANVVGVQNTLALPIGLPAGITLAAPAAFSRRAMIGRRSYSKAREIPANQTLALPLRSQQDRQERSLIRENFQLHPIRHRHCPIQKDLSPQSCRTQGLIRAKTSSSIGRIVSRFMSMKSSSLRPDAS